MSVKARWRSSLLLIIMGIITRQSLCQTDVTRYCNNPVPGLLEMTRGVDVTSLDLIPLDLKGERGFRNPIIQYTCAEGKTEIINGATYELPDQVWTMSQIPAGSLSSGVEILKTSKEVRSAMSSEVGGGLQLSHFAFSASASYKRMQQTLTNTSRYIEYVSAFFSGRRADLKLHVALNLDPLVNGFVDKQLPVSYLDNPAPYEEFIEYFGTHYFRSANYGGMISLLMETSSTYFLGKTNKEVSLQAEASFLAILKVKGGYSSGDAATDERFDSLTTKSVRYYGGNANLLSSQGLEQWQSTISAQPWLFSGLLSPISLLIRSATKRANMEEAVSNHILRAYLDELSRLLYGRLIKWSEGLSALNSLLSRVKALQAQRFLVLDAVEALGNEIEEQVTVPSWFAGGTQLCYQWYPDGDGGQCGGGAESLLCAAPNSMTSYYRDDSDRRQGGCQMQWGIMATGQAAWFIETKICYRWNPDGDGVGQCGGGADRELCAPVNNYTPYYRDDTDIRHGGCQMSWRLVLPSTAPSWMKNVQLCYEWYPDGDGGQCGGVAGRRLCAIADQWTQYYRDDSDDRQGGCQMRWGLLLD